ncbi:EF-hand domain-containing protein 1-like [Lycorma delicatula]|uniref:EF-hand domain-containing protein 1-like n=1 Tax=Lycorma delicatula TaxID=130591 RepID=UPI003F5171F2
MEGMPLLPGYYFRDPTQSSFNIPHTLEYRNGYAISRQPEFGIGKTPLTTSSIKYCKKSDTVRYDPSLTYGRTKQSTVSLFKPHFLVYDKKCLTFFAFFRQSVNESPDESFRIRLVNIIYFLEDDTITVMEPVVENAGFPQGRLIRRSRIPKSDTGDFWHWKDFNVGIDVAMFGNVLHICSCDDYTKEYLWSQGVELNDQEELPFDPYIRNRQLAELPKFKKTPSLADEKLRRYLEYDGKVLRFYIVWDDRDSEYGEMRPYKLHYYLSDDCIDISEVRQENSGRDPYPLLLSKMKLPKNWKDVPANYPAAYLEKSEHEVIEYYQPKDLIVGNTVFLMARRFLIYDCDIFTRNYYKHCLNIEQPPATEISFEKKKPILKPPPPPHIGIGSPEDTLQSCFSVIPKPPKQDVVKYIINSGKKLRYTADLVSVHPEDKGRQFVIEYNLADGKICITELPVANSGFISGRFLSWMLLPKPGTNQDNPEYFTPADFNLGAIIDVYGHRFVITGADLKVYRYMDANPEKFSEDALIEYRNYFLNKGLLDNDIKSKMEEEMQTEGCPE